MRRPPKRRKSMDLKQYLEQTARGLTQLDSAELKRRIQNFRGQFKLDFTEGHLNTLSVDRLRHILMAALITTKSPPTVKKKEPPKAK